MDSLPIETRAPVPHSTQPKPEDPDPVCVQLAAQILENPKFVAQEGFELTVDNVAVVRGLDRGSTLWVKADQFSHPSSINTLFKIVRHFNPNTRTLTLSDDLNTRTVSEILRHLPDVDYLSFKNQNGKEPKLYGGFVWIKTGPEHDQLYGIRRKKIATESPVFQAAVEDAEEGQPDPVIPITAICCHANEAAWRTALWGSPSACGDGNEEECSPWEVMRILDFLGLPSRKKAFDQRLRTFLAAQPNSKIDMRTIANLLADGTLPKTQDWFEKKVSQKLKTILSLVPELTEDHKFGLWACAQRLLSTCPNMTKVAQDAIGIVDAKELIMAEKPTRVVRLEPPGIARSAKDVINALKKALGIEKTDTPTAADFPPNTLVTMGCLSLKRGDDETLDGEMVTPALWMDKRFNGPANLTPEWSVIEDLKIPVNLTLRPDWKIEDVTHTISDGCTAWGTPSQTRLVLRASEYFSRINRWVTNCKLPVNITFPPIELFPCLSGDPLPGVVGLDFVAVGDFLKATPDDFDWENKDLQLNLYFHNGERCGPDGETSLDDRFMPTAAQIEDLKQLLQKPWRSILLYSPRNLLLQVVKQELLNQKLLGVKEVWGTVNGLSLGKLRQIFEKPEQLQHLKILEVIIEDDDITAHCNWLKKLPNLKSLTVALLREDGGSFNKEDFLLLTKLPALTGLVLDKGCEKIDLDTVPKIPNLVFLELTASYGGMPSHTCRRLEKSLCKPFVPTITLPMPQSPIRKSSRIGAGSPM